MNVRRLLKLGLIAMFLAGGIGGYWFVSQTQVGLLDRGSWHVGTTEEDVAVNITFWVDYPGPIPLDLTSFNASVKVKANKLLLLSGRENDFRLAKGNNTITQQPELVVDNLDKWWVSHMRNGEKTRVAVMASFASDLSVAPVSFSRQLVTKTVSTNIEDTMAKLFTQLEGRYRYDSGYPREEAIAVRNIDPRFGDVAINTTEIILEIKLSNLNDYALPLPGFTGSLLLNDITVVDWSRNDTSFRSKPDDDVIPPGSTATVEVVIDVSTPGIEDWFISHVRQDEFTEGQLTLTMFFDFESAGRLIVPAGGYRCPIEFATGLLVDQDSYTKTGECSATGPASYEGPAPAGTDGSLDGSGTLDGSGGDDTTDNGSTGSNDSDGTLDVPLD